MLQEEGRGVEGGGQGLPTRLTKRGDWQVRVLVPMALLLLKPQFA